MKPYQILETSGFHAAVGTAAIAMTALTIGLALVIPAKMTSGGRELPASALLKPASPVATDVGGSPLRVDVIAVREPSMASAQVRNVPPKHKQQG